MTRGPLVPQSQRNNNDCGVACVAMLARVTMEEALAAFRNPESVNNSGADDSEMRYALKSLDLRLGYRHELRGIAKVKEAKLRQTDLDCLVDYTGHWLVWDKEGGRLISPDENAPNWKRVKSYYVLRETV